MNLLDLIKQRRAVCDAATPMPESLATAFRKYTNFFGEQPHGTERQMAAMAEYEPLKSIAASRNERPQELDALAIAVEALQDADAILRRKGATDLQLRMEAAVVVDEALAQIRAKLENK